MNALSCMYVSLPSMPGPCGGQRKSYRQLRGIVWVLGI